ncbi:unnamed protein product [Ixodes persulcatus]
MLRFVDGTSFFFRAFKGAANCRTKRQFSDNVTVQVSKILETWKAAGNTSDNVWIGSLGNGGLPALLPCKVMPIVLSARLHYYRRRAIQLRPGYKYLHVSSVNQKVFSRVYSQQRKQTNVHRATDSEEGKRTTRFVATGATVTEARRQQQQR